MEHLDFPVLGAKWTIGFFGLFHTSVASLAIGLATVVTVCQIVAYRQRAMRYDLFAKRAQLFHVCIYNVGTINAIGLVFALAGLYPQFWGQIFNHFFWPFMIEELCFFILATTLTFHYFFWDRLWGHKKLHIFLGSLLIPFFFIQFYIINAVGGFMLTPGYQEAEASLFQGILGWDPKAYFHPSLLMFTMHRTLANVSYAGYFMAGWCGIRLYLMNGDERQRDYYEDCGRLSFYIAFVAFLGLPVVGYFWSHVLKTQAPEAFWNLMIGRGDVLFAGMDTWWLKQIFVALMLGASVAYFRRLDRSEAPFTLPSVMVYGILCFYLMFYLAMGMVMTWRFFWWMVACCAGGYLLANHMVNYHKGSGKALFLFMGILAFMTVMLGGYAREAARPRFENRYSHYDDIYVPQERQPYLMVKISPDEIPAVPPAPEPAGPLDLIRTRCIDCHTLERVKNYRGDDWERVVQLMRIYGTKLTDEEAETIVEYLKAGHPIEG